LKICFLLILKLPPPPQQPNAQQGPNPNSQPQQSGEKVPLPSNPNQPPPIGFNAPNVAPNPGNCKFLITSLFHSGFEK
jgi:hypothetical protein